MESSPAAAMPASSSRARDPLLLGGFVLPAAWGCHKSLGFCRDIDDAPLASAAAEAENNGSRSPARGAAVEEAQQEAPRRQWNLRERTTWRDYRAGDARHQSKKLGNADAGGGMSRGFSVALTRQEIDADFVAITGRKPPRRPKKRTKCIQRQIEVRTPGTRMGAMPILIPYPRSLMFSLVPRLLTIQSVLPLSLVPQTICPGSSLMEVTRDRYKVNEVWLIFF